jgi:hypothetical protein
MYFYFGLEKKKNASKTGQNKYHKEWGKKHKAKTDSITSIKAKGEASLLLLSLSLFHRSFPLLCLSK